MGCIQWLGMGLLLVLPAAGFGQAARWFPATPSVDIICWQENSRLTRADFQAKIKPPFALDTSLPEFTADAVMDARAVTYTYTLLNDKTGPRKEVAVRVEFYRDQSWMSSGKLFYGPIRTLAHEQLHFDITELTGRKLRWLLARYTAANQPPDSPEAVAAIACIYEEETVLNSLYDEETLFDIKGVAQQRWAGRVRRSLQQLARYKSTERDCGLRLAE